MADYKENSGEATSWRRCYSARIDNPLQGEKTILFWEEDVVKLGEKYIKAQAGSVITKFDQAGIIQLRDIVTNELTGGYTTHQNLYQILYSLYIQTATERDAQLAVT